MIPDPNQASRNYNLEAAQHYLRTGCADKAIESARNCLAQDPDFYEAHAVLLEAYTHAQKWPEAKRESNEVLRLGPTNPRAYYLTARLQVRCRQLDLAVKFLLDGLRVAPHNADLWALLAETQNSRGKRDAARAAAHEAARYAPTHPDYLALRAILETPALPTRSQARLLVSRLLEVLALDPQNRYTWETLARIYAYTLGDWPAVVEAASQALARDPHNSVLQKLLHDANIRQYWAYRVWSAPHRLLIVCMRNVRNSYKSEFAGHRDFRIIGYLYFAIFFIGLAFFQAFTLVTWWWPANFLCQKLLPNGPAAQRVETAAAQRRRFWGMNLLFSVIWLGPPLILADLTLRVYPDSEWLNVAAISWGICYATLGFFALAKLGDSVMKDWSQRRRQHRLERRAAKIKPPPLPK